MALTATQHVNAVLGNKRFVVATVTFDSSYPTNGEALTAALLGLNALDAVVVGASSGRQITWDRTASKLKVFNSVNAHTHPENAAGSYTQSVSTGVNSAAAGTEVADTTDLSALSAQIIAFGS